MTIARAPHPAPTHTGVADGRRVGCVVSSPMGRAGWVVGLSLVTSATAHLEGGGLLPGWHGTALLLVCSCLLWWASTWIATSRAGLLLVLALGQLAGHVSYELGTQQAMSSMGMNAMGPTHPGSTGMADPGMGGSMDGMAAAAPPQVIPATFWAHAHQIVVGSPMAGMQGHHAVAAMWLCHLAAVFICAALLVALQLPTVLRSWLERLVITSGTGVVVDRRRRFPVVRRRCTSRWTLASPPVLRGPPAMA